LACNSRPDSGTAIFRQDADIPAHFALLFNNPASPRANPRGISFLHQQTRQPKAHTIRYSAPPKTPTTGVSQALDSSIVFCKLSANDGNTNKSAALQVSYHNQSSLIEGIALCRISHSPNKSRGFVRPIALAATFPMEKMRTGIVGRGYRFGSA
jgi:hypothetical protein